MRPLSATLRLAALLLVAWGAGAAAKKASVGKRLVKLVKNNGGEAWVKLGLNQQGIRGVFATTNISTGEIAVQVPFDLAVALADFQEESRGWQAQAVYFLSLQYEEPEWWAGMQPYWDSLPKRGHVFTKETWSERKYATALQDEALAEYVLGHYKWTEALYYGAEGLDDGTVSMALLRGDHPAAGGISLQDFAHASGLLASYGFAFPNEEGASQGFLLPLLDLINNGDAGANVKVVRDAEGGNFLAVAQRDIAEGEELLHSYSELTQRNDWALVNHFFIQQHTPPRLCHIDRPGASLYKPGGEADHRDWQYAPYGQHSTLEEAERLEARLAAFPTDLATDMALLLGERDWKMRRILGYRIERKRGLRFIADKVRRQVAAGQAFSDRPAAAAEALRRHSAQEREAHGEEEVLEGEEEEEEEEAGHEDL